MPLRHDQGSLWLRHNQKIHTTLETLSSKSTKSAKRTPNLYLQTRWPPVTRVSSRVEFPKPEFHGTGAISSYIDGESIRIGR